MWLQNGFRQVGKITYFAYALADKNHPSHCLAIEDDAVLPQIIHIYQHFALVGLQRVIYSYGHNGTLPRLLLSAPDRNYFDLYTIRALY